MKRTGRNMIIDCISDLHGNLPDLEGGDLLIVAGDLTATDRYVEHASFYRWLHEQRYRKKIFIAGNHDTLLSAVESSKETANLSFEYLRDSMTEFDGLKIWGSPASVWFRGVNPRCKAFMENESSLKKRFQRIPEDVDILITHGPPYQIMDANTMGFPCGSMELRRELDVRLHPKLHVFGHIHEAYGMRQIGHCTYVNASYVDERYRAVNKPVRVIL